MNSFIVIDMRVHTFNYGATTTYVGGLITPIILDVHYHIHIKSFPYALPISDNQPG